MITKLFRCIHDKNFLLLLFDIKMENQVEIDLQLKMHTEKVREDLELSYGKESSLQNLLEDLGQEYDLDKDKLEVMLLEMDSSGNNSIFPKLIITFLY